MKTVGIIAEYNPFHRGHQYHLKEAMEAANAQACVALLSGPVTQRGEAALWDKWMRAEMAVKNGVDLVLELPFAFACNSAEEFARGGISILTGLGCVTDLAFGCESDPHLVISAAKRSARDNEGFCVSLRRGLEEGLSYPAARGRAMGEFCLEGHENASWDKPNDILGVEYVRQLILQKSCLVPHGIKRRGKYHDEEIYESGQSEKFSSATAIRRAFQKGSWGQIEKSVPIETLSILKEKTPKEANGLDSMLLYRLIQLGPKGLRNVYGCGEGLEYRLWKALPRAKSEEELLRLASCRRYSDARLRRLLFSALAGLEKGEYSLLKEAAMEGRLYARVLGFNQRGAQLLHESKKKGKIPIYTNLNRQLSQKEKRWLRGEDTLSEEEISPALRSLRLDVKAADILRLSRGEDLYGGSDFVRSPYIGHKNKKNIKSP